MRISNSTTSDFSILLGIVAVLLFSVGPQLGSLDTDGDGYPETPVVISISTPVARPSSFVSTTKSSRIRAASMLADIVNRSYYTERDESGPPAGRAALRSFCLLRC
jgi:hypothetical protein